MTYYRLKATVITYKLILCRAFKNKDVLERRGILVPVSQIFHTTKANHAEYFFIIMLS